LFRPNQTELIGLYSPGADNKVEAEFSVNGETPYIKLTSAAPANTQITVVRRVGKTWSDRTPSSTTASAGITMHKNTNSIVNFILQKSTAMPE